MYYVPENEMFKILLQQCTCKWPAERRLNNKRKAASYSFTEVYTNQK
jgi:hypothetical protein